MQFRRMLIGTRAALLVLACIVQAGCATARLNRFHAFAEAGVAYVQASQAVLDEAGTAAIENDSSVLRQARPAFSPEERRDRVKRSNDLIRQRLALLQEAARHGRLLQNYFEALAAMADSQTQDALSKSAGRTFDDITKLGSVLKVASIGSSAVASFVPSITPPVVAHIRVHILRAELQAHGKQIGEELAIQEAVFRAISSELKADVQSHTNLLETQEIIEPYAVEGALPKEWNERRRDILSGSAAAHSAEACAGAAKRLRETFEALAGDKLDRETVGTLVAEIRSVLAIAESIHKVN